MATSGTDRDRIVIVGGGFAGATLAQQLERGLGDRIQIMVVSKDNHLVFTPMLPEWRRVPSRPCMLSWPGER